MQRESLPPFVHSAAVRFSGALYLGKSHGLIERFILTETKSRQQKICAGEESYGFVDSTGAFVSRTRAFSLAEKAGQLNARGLQYAEFCRKLGYSGELRSDEFEPMPNQDLKF